MRIPVFRRRWRWLLTAILVTAGCRPYEAAPAESAQNPPEPPGQAASQASAPELPAEILAFEPWFGDYEEMVDRRLIRALVTYSKTHYFLDGATQRGIAYEALKELEKEINRELDRKTLTVTVAIIPVTRDQIVPALVAGRADLAVANLTVTPDRLEQVDFSDPVAENVREIVVTGPGAPALETLEDLSGREVWVRPSSSYHESLLALNRSLAAEGLAPVEIRPAEEYLGSEDLLEMVNAGLVGIIVVDEHVARFWAQVFDGLELHPDLAVRTGGEVAWMLRKGTPELRRVVNDFVKKNRKGTLLGNILLKRYLKSTRWVRNSLAEEELARFRSLVAYFRKYAEAYDFDWLMVAAQAYQESRLDQSTVSAAGAVGVMQMLPSTAAASPIGIPDVEELEPNIHAGVKYLRHVVDTYFSDEGIDPLNRMLFGFAAYNAGPTRISRLRRKAAERGLDADRWFHNVELVVAEEVGRETVQYVSNIMKYYVAYSLIADRAQRRESEKPPGG